MSKQETDDGPEAAKKMAEWFRAHKRAAYIGNGLYRVKMNEVWYDMFTRIFDALGEGARLEKKVGQGELIEKAWMALRNVEMWWRLPNKLRTVLAIEPAMQMVLETLQICAEQKDKRLEKTFNVQRLHEALKHEHNDNVLSYVGEFEHHKKIHPDCLVCKLLAETEGV